MFKKDKKGFSEKGIDTLIGQKTTMSGELHTKGIVRIDGAYKGNIITESAFIAGENADIRGNIKCRIATVAGRVQGNIETEFKLEILKPGIIMGDINVGSLVVEDGAFFSGKCLMGGDEVKIGESAGEKPLSDQGREEPKKSMDIKGKQKKR